MAFLTGLIAAVSIFAATPLGGFLINAAIGIGLSLLSTAFAKKPEKPQGGTKLDVQYGADVGRSVGVGLFAVAGHDVYTNTYGNSNKWIQKVFVLSDFPITEVTRVAVNGEWVTPNWADTEAGRGANVPFMSGKDYLRIRVYDGRQTALLPIETDASGLIGASNPSGRWTAQHIGRGVAFVVVNVRWDDEDMASFPQLLFECRGARLYDVRKDSTAGGSGAHRWADQSTWEYSENPIIQAYNYERGFYVNGDLIVGKGMPASELPAAPWIAAANVCDQSVSGKARYRSGFLFSAEDGVTHADNLEPVLNACAAALVERVDGDHPLVGATQAVVATLTDNDMIVGAPARYQAKRSRSELVNSVFGQYNEPEDLWSASSYPPQINATALAADRERHAVPKDFRAVFDKGQAIRLADIALRENRYQASAQITVRPRWITLEVGDWITWASAKRGTKTYRIIGRSLAPLNEQGARNVTLTLQEVGPGIYDSAVTIPEVTPRVNLAAPAYTSTLPGFNALPTTVSTEGRSYPAIYATWSLIDDVTVDAVLLRYAKASDPTTYITKTVTLDRAAPQVSAVLVEGILPQEDYLVEGTVVPNPPRNVFWAGPVSVTTDEEELSIQLADLQQEVRDLLNSFEFDISANAGAISQEVIDRAAAIAAEAQARASALATEAATRLASDQQETAERIADVTARAVAFRQLSDALMAVALETSEQGARGLEHIQQLRTELKVAVDNVSAAYTLAITAAVGPGSAVVERFEQLEVEIDSETAARQASISSLQTAYLAADAAEATARDVLATQIRGAYTGNDYQGVSTGLIAQLKTVFTSQYEALALAFAEISVGAGEQFDYARIWLFDVTIEGWTGNGTPTRIGGGGWLRPANHASDPYVVSPAGLAIDTNVYPQIRLRIRKVGTPTWEGNIWWKTAGDATWDAARRVTIAEPSYDANGVAVVSVTPGYDLVLDQIRLDLSSTQAVGAYFELDWVAIGRPSPGASTAALSSLQQAVANGLSAEASDREELTTALLGTPNVDGITLQSLSQGLLYQERIARSTADASIAEDVTQLEARLFDAETGLDATAAGLQDFTARVEAAEYALGDHTLQLSAQAELLTALSAEIEDKAEADALDVLSAEVAALGGPAAASQASATRSVRAELLNVEMEAAEQGAANLAAEQQVRTAIANAYQTLDAYARQIEGKTEVNAGLIAGVQTELPKKAGIDLVNALSASLVEQGNTLSAYGQAITSIQLILPDKVDLDLFTALVARVTTTEEGVDSQAAAIAAINLALIDKASTGITDAQAARITDTEEGISALGSRVQEVESELPKKASAIALEAALAEVSDLGGVVSAQASLISGVEAKANEATATGRIKFEAVAAPAGVSARFSILVRASTGATTYIQSGLFLDAMSNGTSRIVALADKFVVSDGAATAFPLVYEGGVLKLNAAVIGSLVVDGTIEGKKLVINGIPTDRIAENAVSNYVNVGNTIHATGDFGSPSGEQVMLATRMLVTAGKYLEYTAKVVGGRANNDTNVPAIIFRVKVDGVLLQESEIVGVQGTALTTLTFRGVSPVTANTGLGGLVELTVTVVNSAAVFRKNSASFNALAFTR